MNAIDIIMIPVADQQKAKEFYLKAGFKLIAEAPSHHGQTWIQVGLPNSSTTLSLAAFHGIICETSDIEKEIALLEGNGIHVGKIDDTPWGRFAWFKDLDGNSLCLRQK
jgi:catechol 2,3-dioxygenase-like lactoylglutathione lyase family enzyme